MADKSWSALNKGAYSASTAYTIGDFVSYQGGFYTCIQNTTGHAPTVDDDNAYWALVASKGDTGEQGIQGVQGVQGIQGVQGVSGVSAGILYAFATAIDDADPGNGKLKLNHATLSSVSQIFADNLDDGGNNVSSLLDSFDDSTNTPVRGTIKISKRGSESVYAIYSVTGAVTDGTGYRKIPVTHVVSSGSFSASDVLSLLFSRAGNKGSDGAGSGDVMGPESAVDSNFAGFDTTTGKLLKDSGKKASDFDVAGSASTVQGNLNSHMSDTSTHGVSEIVGTDINQTFTGIKTFTTGLLKIADLIDAAQGLKVLAIAGVASAVNWIKMISAATGGSPIIQPDGETNVGLDIKMKGTGKFRKPTVVMMQVVAGDTDGATGDGKAYYEIPEELNGMNMTGCGVTHVVEGTTNTSDYQIHNETDNQDMLSTKITVDSTEKSSRSAATPPVIDTTKDDVVTGDVIRLDCDALSSTKPKGLIWWMRFELP